MVKITCLVFFAAILQCVIAERVIFPGRGCGTLNEIKYLKELPEDTSGLSCAIYDPDLVERLPSPMADCYDVYKAKKPLPGTYTLQPGNSSTIFDAYCLEEGWTVIQSRGQYGNPKDFFLRKWEEYVKGFGVPGESYDFLLVKYVPDD